MFPAGAAGVALFGLRVTAAGYLFPGPSGQVTKGLFSFFTVIVLSAAILLCVGLFTPVACLLAIAAQLSLMFQSAGELTLVQILHLSTVLFVFLLGPGGYSVDARIFGRRLVLPPGR